MIEVSGSSPLLRSMNKNIEYDIADVVIGRPYDFSVGHKRFCLYPVTLAKMYLLGRQVDNLNINKDNLQANPYMEVLRIVKNDRETCCHILAYHATPNTYKALFTRKTIVEKKNVFQVELTDEELASLMVVVLKADRTEEFMDSLGILKDNQDKAKVIEIKSKSDKEYVYFGGNSVFGRFIAPLKEMGYTDDEILYEKGYTYLRLMLADKAVSIHLTDEERQQLGMTASGTIDANDPENTRKIINIFKERGIEKRNKTTQK